MMYVSTNDPNTGDIYSGLDRFGRVDNCLWTQSPPPTMTTTLAQIQYGYDRASNRTWRDEGVLAGVDELYAYDGLYRLNDQTHGTLNGTQTAITSGTFEQQCGMDVGWSFLNVDSPTAAGNILADQGRASTGMNPGLNSDKNVQATTTKRMKSPASRIRSVRHGRR